MTVFLELLGDHTVQNVVLGAALLGLGSGALGVFAVLREQSLVGDALSHATLPGVALGFIVAGSRHLPSIITGALISGTAAALLALLLTRRTRLKTDAALGIVLSLFFALGVVLLTYIQGTGDASQGGLDSFLFGQAAAILRSDLTVMLLLTATALGLVVLLWKELKLITFDPLFAGSLGLPVVVLEAVLTLTIALAIVIGLQLVGVVLMAAMVVAPAAAARQWTARLETMAVLAALFGVISGVSGALISTVGRNLATGPLIVLAATVLVLLSLMFAPHRGLVAELVERRRATASLRQRELLATLYRLGTEHGDPSYPVEQGMLHALHGAGTRAGVDSLERSGLIRQVPHMPEEGRHWTLTDEGVRRAREELGGRQENGPDRGQAGSADTEA